MNTKRISEELYLLQQQNELKEQLQQGINDIAQGRYTTHGSAQHIAAQIKLLGRQQQSTEP